MPEYIQRESGLFLPDDPGEINALVVMKPHGKRLDEATELVDYLVGTGQMDSSAVVETEACKDETALKVQQAALKHRPNAIIVALGDATVATVANSLLVSDNEDLRRTAIYAANYASAGNMHHATQDTHNPTSINLAGQPVVETYPMEVTVQRPAKTIERTRALSCASFGMTAIIGDLVNTDQYRNSWLPNMPGGKKLRDVLVGEKAFRIAPRFSIFEAGCRQRLVTTLMFANSDPIGTQWGFGANLTEPVIHRVLAENKRRTLKMIMDLKLGRLAIERQSEPYRFTVSTFPDDEYEGVWCELDGDAGLLPKGTYVSVASASAENTAYFVSDRLKRLQLQAQHAA